MGWTCYGQISRKLKVERWNSKDKSASKGSKIDTDWIEYFPKTLVKKRSKKKSKHVDNVVKTAKPLPWPITKAISITHNNQRPLVEIFATNLLTSSCAYQYFVYDEISY